MYLRLMRSYKLSFYYGRTRASKTRDVRVAVADKAGELDSYNLMKEATITMEERQTRQREGRQL
jgi:hypothetical protein